MRERFSGESAELRQQIFLITTIVGQKDDLSGVGDPIVRDVEEIDDFVEQHFLALLHGDVLAYDDHTIVFFASGRPVVEFRHIFRSQTLVLEFAGHHDLFFNIFRLLSRLGFYGVWQWAIQFLPNFLRQILGNTPEVGHTVVAKDKTHAAIGMPTVEMFGLREVGIAAKQHALEIIADSKKWRHANGGKKPKTRK